MSGKPVPDRDPFSRFKPQPTLATVQALDGRGRGGRRQTQKVRSGLGERPRFRYRAFLQKQEHFLSVAYCIRHERLTVRQVEALMRPIRRDPRDPATIPFDADPRGPDHRWFEARLSEPLGIPVTVEYARDDAGRLILAFSDLEILDGWLERLGYGDDTD